MARVHKGARLDASGSRYSGGRAITSESGETMPSFTKRKVNYRTVVCPDCKARIGDGCFNPETGKDASYHASRRRMATRLDNELRDAEVVTDWRKVRKPGRREDPDGVVCPGPCGLTIRADSEGKPMAHTLSGKAMNTPDDPLCPRRPI